MFYQVSDTWSVVPQYSYGWAVPFLGAYLFWGRWKSRPEPGRAPPGALLAGLAVTLVLALGPIRLVQEANRDWQFVSWSMAGSVTALTALAILWAGGWPWLRHFAFPILFPLVAVPWPSKLEQPLVHGLMNVVAAIVVEILTWLNIAAMQHGNVIEIGRGPVGIDEACSGIQSFQASVMVSLFIGELFAFTAARRLALFGIAVGWAFLCNVMRTLFLSLMTHREGMGAIDRWHDTAGNTVMILCYVGIIGLALWMGRGMKPVPASAPSTPPRRIPVWLGVITVVWLFAAEVFTGWWYRSREAVLPRSAGWRVDLKQNQPGYHDKEFSGRERTILRFNEAASAQWKAGDHVWQASFIRWNAGNLAVDTAKHHNPTVCLVSAGAKIVEEYPRRDFQVAGHPVNFRCLLFEVAKKPMYSFFCLYDDFERPPMTGPAKLWSAEEWSARARWENVRKGRRTKGLQLLSVGVFGCPQFEDAAAEFQQILDRVSRPR
jgi:exosortase